MKKTLIRFLALAMAFTMLVGAAAAAEPVEIETQHIVLQWMGQVMDVLLTAASDEDGCMQYTLSTTGYEDLSAFLQIGQAVTIGSDPENALTITPEAARAAAELFLQAVLPGGAPELDPASICDFLGRAAAYAESEDFAADRAALSRAAMGETLRMMQVAMAQGCITMAPKGKFRMELDSTALIKMAGAYLASLAADQNIAAALTSLKVWPALGLEEQAEGLVAQAMAAVAACAEALTRLDIPPCFTLSLIYDPQTGLELHAAAMQDGQELGRIDCTGSEADGVVSGAIRFAAGSDLYEGRCELDITTGKFFAQLDSCGANGQTSPMLVALYDPETASAVFSMMPGDGVINQCIASIDEAGVCHVSGYVLQDETVVLTTSGTVDPARKEIHYTFEGTDSADVPFRMQVDAVYKDVISFREDLCLGSDMQITEVYSFDPETLQLRFCYDTTVRDQMSSHYEVAGDLVMDDCCIAYVLDIATDIAYPAQQIDQHEGGTFTLGLRNLEPGNTECIHGEFFVETAVRAFDEEEEHRVAAEFILKDGVPQTTQIIVTLDQQELGRLFAESEITTGAPAPHAEGIPLTAQDLLGLILSLIPMDGTLADAQAPVY